MRGYLKLAWNTPDACVWPDPSDPKEIEWALRHGTPTREQLITAASFVSTYKQMCFQPQRTTLRRIRQIRAHLAERSNRG
jgi:hypothetical protein